MIRQQFERNITLQLGVERAKHNAHSAFTKARLHEERADACAYSQCQCGVFLCRNVNRLYTQTRSECKNALMGRNALFQLFQPVQDDVDLRGWWFSAAFLDHDEPLSVRGNGVIRRAGAEPFIRSLKEQAGSARAERRWCPGF